MVLLDGTIEPFSHGHTYVGFSRVRNRDNIKLIITETQLHDYQNDINNEPMPTLSNIVYKNLLEIVNKLHSNAHFN